MRFLFCSFASPGFLYPLIRLGAELSRRGHQVEFVSSLAATPALTHGGFARIPRGVADGESFDVRRWYDALSNAIDYKHIEYACSREPPDALVTHHLSLATLIAGERMRLPVATLGPMTYLYPSATLDGPRRSPETEHRLQWRLAEGIATFNAVRQLFRLPPVAPTLNDHALLGDLYMLRTAPELEPGLLSLPSRVHIVGPCVWEPMPTNSHGDCHPECEWTELRREFALPDAPVVYVNNGRSFGGPNFWPTLVEALAEMPVQAVASVGRMDSDLGKLPPNMLTRAHIPQDLVLPRASAMIAGGHTAAVLGAALHGVPSVLVPYGVDTPDNAERLTDAGCACCLDIESVTPKAIRDAVETTFADQTMRASCVTVSKALRHEATTNRAAALVEMLAQTRSVVERPARETRLL